MFTGDDAAKAEQTYAAPWDSGQMVIAPKAGQTELKLAAATSDSDSPISHLLDTSVPDMRRTKRATLWFDILCYNVCCSCQLCEHVC